MRALYVVFIMCIYSFLWSQDVEKKVIIKKTDQQSDNVWISKDGEKKDMTSKTVTVDVMKSGDDQRKVTIITKEDGKDKVMEWTDNGEIPADIQKQLKEQGIDVKILRGGDMEQEMEIIVHREGGDEDYEFEWNGEGEMPMKMKELMEEHDIDIEEYLDDSDMDREKKIIIRKKTASKGDHKARHKGHKNEKKYRIVTIDEDGGERVMEWVGEEGPGERDMVFMDDHRPGRGPRSMRIHGLGRDNMMFFSDDEDRKEVRMSDAYMGAQIETAEQGVAVLDLLKDSPADKANLAKDDVIQRLNGARTRTMDDLLNLLGYYEPGDKVELTVLRDGKEKKLSMTLGKRPDHYR